MWCRIPKTSLSLVTLSVSQVSHSFLMIFIVGVKSYMEVSNETSDRPDLICTCMGLFHLMIMQVFNSDD